MEFPEFVTALETYYGIQYPTSPALELQLMQRFIAARSGLDLENLFSRLIAHHSKKWKSLPDIAMMKEVLESSNESVEAEALRWWGIITRTANALNDIICEDIRVQQCIEALGGWQEFCARDPQYENLHRKEFCRLFKLYTNEPCADEPRVLHGMYTLNKLVNIGNKERCQIAYEQAMKSSQSLVNSTIRQLADALSPAV